MIETYNDFYFYIDYVPEGQEANSILTVKSFNFEEQIIKTEKVLMVRSERTKIIDVL